MPIYFSHIVWHQKDVSSYVPSLTLRGLAWNQSACPSMTGLQVLRCYWGALFKEPYEVHCLGRRAHNKGVTSRNGTCCRTSKTAQGLECDQPGPMEQSRRQLIRHSRPPVAVVSLHSPLTRSQTMRFPRKTKVTQGPCVIGSETSGSRGHKSPGHALLVPQRKTTPQRNCARRSRPKKPDPSPTNYRCVARKTI